MNVGDVQNIGPRQQLLEDLRAADHRDLLNFTGRSSVKLVTGDEGSPGVCATLRAEQRLNERGALDLSGQTASRGQAAF